ncbi:MULTISPECIES: MFS transporter [unclassified Bradyrhizobium]|uniref:MFS transporter n=2 Tax=Bradyrhizobium TaxID=374 RepID=UPI001BABFF66|nr:MULTISPECIES: MFS transporter [unclassified Bradyrhizobium]MBR1305341.1 MFS transporter [Bradyrhizobium sp. U87765 SZCCT0110]MBR1321127.1 MFS transporter [Bradyrhizobium sp. U87765 SZCCT0109]MBR1350219.1 MFS transporter [Bradyrhizobium sp. U87765 SZCCT0048]
MRTAMQQPVPARAAGPSPSLARILVLPSLVIMLGLMSLGAPMVVLAVEVDRVLGFGPVIAGLVLATEALVTLITRPAVGRIADRRGTHRAVTLGLVAAAVSGLFYLLAGLLPLGPAGALALILAGRVAMGVGQGFLFTGGTAWSVDLVSFDQAGRAISWIGMAMFVGIAAGTALGGMAGAVAAWLEPAIALNGFAIAALLTMIAPLAGLVFAIFAPAAPIHSSDAAPASLGQIVRAIWRPSLGFGLAATGYSAVTSFVVLAFVTRGWATGDIAVSAFVAAFVIARVPFGDISDRATGSTPILLALAALAGGLLVLWIAPSPWIAIAAAALSGFGMSLTYPLLAVPAIRAVPRAQTASAIGLYDGSYDLAALITPPVCGIIAATAGYQTIFLVAGIAVLAAMLPAHAAWRIDQANRGDASSAP